MGDNRKCAPHLSNFYSCLGRSGRDISQCEKELASLTQCSETDKNENYCVGEMSRLLRCARNPDTAGCAKEFIVFRECHRPAGPEILIKDNMYTISKDHLHKYNVSSEVICPVSAPSRSKQSLLTTIEKLKAACGFKNYEENFTPKIKS
ncbi:hypothetical protein X943_003069 [Babesia divergens]|uniref:IMS import disulfide relay-system CHCH-CHCH-like Cx9C domain-containing protein n=1 Tax=Babesia divergens TaxID=32595 RepID=A0AAD9GJS5_BABDI|nr:hypothetical protein X943_003069 [Babesia divergens]